MPHNRQQQQQPKIEVELTLAGPIEKDGKNYVSGIAKARQRNDVLVNEDVRFYLDGKPDSVVETTDEAGQHAKEFEVVGYGAHTLQAFFPRLGKWTYTRGFTLKKPEKKEKDKPTVCLYVRMQRGPKKILLTVQVKDDKGHIWPEDIPITICDPRNPNQPAEKTTDKVLSKELDYPKKPMWLVVTGGGDVQKREIYPL